MPASMASARKSFIWFAPFWDVSAIALVQELHHVPAIVKGKNCTYTRGMVMVAMTGEEYRQALQALGYTHRQAAAAFGISLRTSKNYAASGISMKLVADAIRQAVSQKSAERNGKIVWLTFLKALDLA